MRFAKAVLLDINAGFGTKANFGVPVWVRVGVRRLNIVVILSNII